MCHPAPTTTRRPILGLALLLAAVAPAPAAEPATIRVDMPMEPPAWAALERELLRANARGCEAFFARYFDDRGFLECVERWGGDDGPDDAIENLSDWPVLHALGATDRIRILYERAWEGHLRQYTLARTKDVEFARDGMYYKEFPVMFDWMHNGEGLTVFGQQGLSDPNDPRFRRRVVRFAGFYTNEDPGAPNYDPEHKIIRSLFNGSRGPLLRKATALDWAGDPIEVEHRFRPRHGEGSYRLMLEHFKDYTDIVGDHPQNLSATTLALNAFMLTHDRKYRDWLLEYVDAWRQRMIDNGGIIPSNIGLDGTIGGACGGKWYGGVYGWGFSVLDPATGELAHRTRVPLGLIGFGNAHLLTGDDRYLDPWRRQIDLVNAQKKVVDGRDQYPHMHSDRGWYAYSPRKYDDGAMELWYWSMRSDDRARLATTGWLAYLDGKDPGYPERALRADFAAIRRKVAGLRADATTPDTRLADDPMEFNPATVGTLVQLTLGGLPPAHNGSIPHCRVRHFDPQGRRPGLPEDVAALVESLTADEATLVLVNVDQAEPRTVVVQAGGYAEHQLVAVVLDGREVRVDRPEVSVQLAPGCGARLLLKMRRYANPPTLAFPWDRG
ncbi:MAG TPA: hypothetical protein VG406_18250 [Isosphaeraceae bacterium]|jgi:hypothetical protein|nr:hypothetical protein [Isosphaeraceae bacterium]